MWILKKRFKLIVLAVMVATALTCFPGVGYAGPIILGRIAQGLRIQTVKALVKVKDLAVGYAFGKGMDHALGYKVREDLKTLERRLVAEVSVGSSDIGALRSDLKMVQTQLAHLERLSNGRASTNDLLQLQADLSKQIRDLASSNARVRAELKTLNVNIDQLREELRRLRDEISTLRSNAVPLRGQASNDPIVSPSGCGGVWSSYWLQFSNVWYGPFSNGDWIVTSPSGGFLVWSATTHNNFGWHGALMTFPDPYFQWSRNTWSRLPNTFFWVCIDTVGRISAVHNSGM